MNSGSWERGHCGETICCCGLHRDAIKSSALQYDNLHRTMHPALNAVAIQVNKLQCLFRQMRALKLVRLGTALAPGQQVPIITELFKRV
jgi:hypothetical protein